MGFGTQVRHRHVHNNVVFFTVCGSTVGNVTSIRNFGGIPEKYGAFGISHDAILGSYYVWDFCFCICQVCNGISLVVCSGGLIRMIYRVAITSLTLRRLMSYIYGAPILDVSRSHTTTRHSR